MCLPCDSRKKATAWGYCIPGGAAVGGGSTVYANTLYRAKSDYFNNPQWSDLDDWEKALTPHYDTAERMLGVNTVPYENPGDELLKDVAKRFGKGVKLSTAQDEHMPNPTYIDAANKAAGWLAEKTGGIPQSMILEATANIPTTAHILGGVVIGKDVSSGVIDSKQQVFGYHKLLVCDGSAVPANPGVNPSLTITAMTERAMTFIPEKSAEAGNHAAMNT